MSSIDALLESLRQEIGSSEDPIGDIQRIREALSELHPIDHPIDLVRWVPAEKVKPNDYNPNAVADIEMGLLLRSIEHDGYTQPIVTVYDAENDIYVIVDGFHRYFVGSRNDGVKESTRGHLPIVVIDKTINERMAATVRHNRARGKHSIQGMSSMVFSMLDQGMSDAEICNELGMEPEELLRLKHVTGFSKLFADTEYNMAWVARNQIRAKKRWEAEEAAQQEAEGGSTPGDENGGQGVADGPVDTNQTQEDDADE